MAQPHGDLHGSAVNTEAPVASGDEGPRGHWLLIETIFPDTVIESVAFLINPLFQERGKSFAASPGA